MIFLILLVFGQWLTLGVISSGDYPFFFRESLGERFSLPLAWNNGYNVPFSTQWPHEFLTGLLSKIGMDFAVVERLAWFWPFLVISILSSRYLAKTLFPENEFVLSFAPFIYLLNTYVLTIIVGGQVGIILSYAFAPLVIATLIKYIDNEKNYYAILSGLAFAIQIVFDPRISFITAGIISLYSLTVFKYNLKKYVKLFLVPLVVTIGLHFYWILPTLLVRKSPLPIGYGSTNWVDFLSFASFSNTISLLHPNWPESIFGKTYFMRPEFLIIPIIAFSSLFFIFSAEKNGSLGKNSRNNILFFAFIALIGSFLAKGSKPPFGEIYLWLFNNLPGMNMFRDPTKFYVLISLSYSILIPFSVQQTYSWLKSKIKKSLPASRQETSKSPPFASLQRGKQSKIQRYSPNIFLLLITGYLLLLIKPAWTGQLSGTFKVKEVPKEYIELKDFIHNQPQFFRTFWTPQHQRFGFYESNHPTINASDYLKTNDPAELVQELRKEGRKEELQRLGVKYLIIPFDSDGEMFLTDRKYDHQKRLKTEEELTSIEWLEKKNLLEKIAIFELKNPKDHFWFEGNPSQVNYKMVDPTRYLVTGETTRPNNLLVFSETYDPRWALKINSKEITSEKSYESLNSFIIPAVGKWNGEVEFTPQKYVNYGLIVSGITLLLSMTALIVFSRK